MAVISIAGITVTQIYWVRKAFDLRENQFNRDVQTALSNVADKIFEINRTPAPATSAVTQVSTNYFTVTTNGPVNPSLLEFLIKTEFEKRHIVADYEYGIYSCADQCMTGGNYVSPDNGNTKVSLSALPTWKEDGYYFGVRFPLIEANLVGQMGIWSFSSAVLLIVILFFSYTLFVMLRQRKLSEIQKDFINNMTHEFRTPLSTIAISSEVLKDPNIVTTPDRLLSYASIIETETQRLRKQVERVLQMADLRTQDQSLKKERLDLHELIRQAVTNQNTILASRGGVVELQLNAQASALHGDALHLGNIFFNLLDNAIKYCKDKPSIIVRSVNRNKMIVIEVEDNGIGIAADHLKKIFHQFYRVPTGNRHDVKGFGIGLHYVKMMVEAHGGKVTAQSTVGHGTTFTVLLPVI